MVIVSSKKAESVRAVAGGARACWIGNRLLVPEEAAVRFPAGPIVVTPWDVLDDVPAGPSLRATSRDVSAGGLSFAHAGLLTCRFAAVSCRTNAADGTRTETMLVRLLWCRFIGRHRYLSGGRFERTFDEVFDIEALG